MNALITYKKTIQALAIFSLIGILQADDSNESEFLTGNWNGSRDKIENAGVTPFLSLTGEFWSNVDGGVATGERCLMFRFHRQGVGRKG